VSAQLTTVVAESNNRKKKKGENTYGSQFWTV